MSRVWQCGLWLGRHVSRGRTVRSLGVVPRSLSVPQSRVSLCCVGTLGPSYETAHAQPPYTWQQWPPLPDAP